MHAIILGAAAGGGFPQWNCGCAGCRRARTHDDAARPCSQLGAAVTGDGQNYLLIGASPDLRDQILRTPELAPRGQRHSPIKSVLILNGDIDGLMGLLHLRESHRFTLYAPPEILDILTQNPIFDVLRPHCVQRVTVTPDQTVTSDAGVTFSLLRLPGKVPLYQETPGARDAEPAPAYAADVTSITGHRLILAPNCADIDDHVIRKFAEADTLLIDGTLFTDDEMITAGLGTKTGRRMGHAPISGDGGSMARLHDLPARKIYWHINNSNPILCRDSAPWRAVTQAGFEIAYDGMVISATNKETPP